MSVDLANKAALGNFSEEVAAWVCKAMASHLQGAELDQAMGLDRATRIRERNSALIDAAKILQSARPGSPWVTAGRLEKAIKRFETRIQPALLADPSRALLPIDEAILRACRCGVRMPKTQRKLFDFLK